MGAKINVKQLNNLKRKFKKLGNYSKQELSNEIGHIALDSVRIAKKEAPVDTGTLRSEIVSEVSNKEAKVSSKAPYSPYIEFGTGDKVSLTDMRELGIPDSYAQQFKGGKNGVIKPQPFFFGSVREALSKGEKRIDAKLKKLTK